MTTEAISHSVALERDHKGWIIPLLQLLVPRRNWVPFLSRVCHISLPILHVCMNTRSGREEFKNFWIILDSGSSSTIVTGKLTSKLKTKETAENTWETQSETFTASNKVNINFCLPDFSATNIVTWKFHIDESTNSRYYIILGRYLLTALVLDLKFSGNVIIGREGPYEGWLAHIIDVSKYDLTSITD